LRCPSEQQRCRSMHRGDVTYPRLFGSRWALKERLQPQSLTCDSSKPMNKDELRLVNTLQRHGVAITTTNEIRLNSGSESPEHLVAKALVAHIAAQEGWRVSSEVDVPNGEIDVVLHKTPHERVWAIELETDPTTEGNNSKLQRYVRDQIGIDEIAIIDVSDMPVEIPLAIQYLHEELPICRV